VESFDIKPEKPLDIFKRLFRFRKII